VSYLLSHREAGILTVLDLDTTPDVSHNDVITLCIT